MLKNKQIQSIQGILTQNPDPAVASKLLWEFLKRHYRRSIVIFSIMYISYFLFANLTIVINVYLLRVANIGESGGNVSVIMAWVVSIIVLSVAGGLCGSIMAFLELRRSFEKSKRRVRDALAEIARYNVGKSPYDSDDRQAELINRISLIRGWRRHVPEWGDTEDE